jgi:hypothetical protein
LRWLAVLLLPLPFCHRLVFGGKKRCSLEETERERTR